jgi:hypothetical protein
MSNRDEVVLEQSMMSARDEPKFNRKMYHTVQDNNNSTYSNNQIYFQLSNIYNLNKYYDWTNGLLIIPIDVEVKLTSSAGTLLKETTDASGNIIDTNIHVALKNNLHLINSMVMSVNSKIIHQSTGNINEYFNFVKLTEVTNNTLPYYDYLNFVPEDSNDLNKKYVFGYDAGVPNLLKNKISEFDSFKYKTDKLNIINPNYQTQFIKNGLKSQYIDNRYVEPAGANVRLDTVHHYEYMAYIKLSDISHFFKEVGLAKLFVDQFTLFANLGKVVYKLPASTGVSPNLAAPNLSSTGVTVESSTFQFNTCPFYVDNDKAILVNSNAIALDDRLSFEIKIGNSMKRNCEIFIAGFELDPTVENRFLSSPIRTFYFKDIYNTQPASIDANSNFSIKLNNSVTNPVGVLIIPYIGSFHTSNRLITSSCENIEPNTPTIGCSLKNLNILIGGQQLLLKNADYNYEHFLSNMDGGGLNVVNGGASLETSLLNLKRWNFNHKYYYFNCNNIMNQLNVAQNIELQGINDNNFKLNLSIFIITKKRCDINVENGNIAQLI